MLSESFDKSKISIHHGPQAVVSDKGQGTLILRVLYEGIAIGEAFAKDQGDGIAEIDFTLQPSLVPKDFALKALFKSSVQELSAIFHRLYIRSCDPDVGLVLKALSFTESDGAFVYKSDIERAKLLIKTKTDLLLLARSSQKVGRGFVTDVSAIAADKLALVCEEYNQIAWGVTGWARHAEIANDELKVISDYVKGSTLEIGAGSGRVTRALAKHATSVVASDYLPEVVENLKTNLSNIQNVKFAVENILSPNLPESSFDCVCFWENGLGGILDTANRKAAVENMCARLSVGGMLILGARTLSDQPCDHLMIATQNEKVFGVYHCFSEQELLAMLPDYMELIEMRVGGERPAGGHQIFMIARRKTSTHFRKLAADGA